MKLRYILFVVLVVLFFGCTDKSQFEEIEDLNNPFADESIEWFEITNVSFETIGTSNSSHVTITFTSKYDAMSDVHKAMVNQIGVYKNGILQFTLDDPKATTITDEFEEKGSTLCYQFSFMAVPPLSADIHDIKSSRLNTVKCFVVE